MERRPFGPTRLEVPVIGQGTWLPTALKNDRRRVSCGDRGYALWLGDEGVPCGATRIKDLGIA
jgi:hypothetical protein